MRHIDSTRRLRFLLLTIGMVGWLVMSGFAYSTQTLTVCPSGCSFQSIQQAINIARWGATIQVLPGIYQESLRISKSLTLQGVDATQVILKSPDRTQDVIHVSSFPFPVRVQISRVTITEGRAGIYMEGIGRLTVTQSIIRDNSGGMFVEGFIHVHIADNRLEGNGRKVFDSDFVFSGKAGGLTLRLEGFPHLGLLLLTAEILNNEIVGNQSGIQIDGAKAWVKNNHISGSWVAGIVIYDASWAFIQGNEIIRNSSGIQVYGDPQVTLLDNVIADNEDQRK